ncbi:hypothetical protein PCE1_001843 [Barthelona sp. PCE]
MTESAETKRDFGKTLSSIDSHNSNSFSSLTLDRTYLHNQFEKISSQNSLLEHLQYRLNELCISTNAARNIDSAIKRHQRKHDEFVDIHRFMNNLPPEIIGLLEKTASNGGGVNLENLSNDKHPSHISSIKEETVKNVEKMWNRQAHKKIWLQVSLQWFKHRLLQRELLRRIPSFLMNSRRKKAKAVEVDSVMDLRRLSEMYKMQNKRRWIHVDNVKNAQLSKSLGSPLSRVRAQKLEEEEYSALSEFITPQKANVSRLGVVDIRSSPLFKIDHTALKDTITLDEAVAIIERWWKVNSFFKHIRSTKASVRLFERLWREKKNRYYRRHILKTGVDFSKFERAIKRIESWWSFKAKHSPRMHKSQSGFLTKEAEEVVTKKEDFAMFHYALYRGSDGFLHLPPSTLPPKQPNEFSFFITPHLERMVGSISLEDMFEYNPYVFPINRELPTEKLTPNKELVLIHQILWFHEPYTAPSFAFGYPPSFLRRVDDVDTPPGVIEQFTLKVPPIFEASERYKIEEGLLEYYSAGNEEYQSILKLESEPVPEEKAGKSLYHFVIRVPDYRIRFAKSGAKSILSNSMTATSNTSERREQQQQRKHNVRIEKHNRNMIKLCDLPEDLEFGMPNLYANYSTEHHLKNPCFYSAQQKKRKVDQHLNSMVDDLKQIVLDAESLAAERDSRLYIAEQLDKQLATNIFFAFQNRRQKKRQLRGKTPNRKHRGIELDKKKKIPGSRAASRISSRPESQMSLRSGFTELGFAKKKKKVVTKSRKDHLKDVIEKSINELDSKFPTLPTPRNRSIPPSRNDDRMSTGSRQSHNSMARNNSSRRVRLPAL